MINSQNLSNSLHLCYRAAIRSIIIKYKREIQQLIQDIHSVFIQIHQNFQLQTQIFKFDWIDK
jgi:hypothetical protein